MPDISQDLQAQVESALASHSPLLITGGATKAFYGRQIQGDVLDVRGHSGIINYEPTELVITAMAGTPLKEIESALAEQGQMLPFEPPHYGDSATLGGTIACNLSGPRRPYTGAARDYVLGTRIINGKAQILRFGGEVMKNVAGYDASRLMCGAQGTLGVLLDVSLKVLPIPEVEITLVQECDTQQAIDSMHRWVLASMPLSASCYDGERLFLRLASNASEIAACREKMGGELLQDADVFWQQLKEQQLAFFDTDEPVWRLSMASNQAPLSLQGETFYEWGGALRWLKGEESADRVRHTLDSLEGHATLYRNNPSQLDPFHELSPGLARLHYELKQAFDPEHILNPGRLYADF